MEDKSNSLLRYPQLGKLVKDHHVFVGSFIPSADDGSFELPQFFNEDASPFTLDIQHELNENHVQNIVNRAFVGQQWGAGYYSFDTHNTKTFLGDDLQPDLMVTSDACADGVPLSEGPVCFLLELTSGRENPCAAEHLGQAASYGMRILELSSPFVRASVVIVVTNLQTAAVVHVSRGSPDFQYKYATMSASEALGTVYHATRRDLGLLNKSNSYRLGDDEYKLANYLGSGATAFVYSTRCGNVAKFYLHGGRVNNSFLIRERDNLVLLNETLANYGKEVDFGLQRVVDCSEGRAVKSVPFLILAPLGTVIHSRGSRYFDRAAVLKVLRSIRFAHIECKLLHLDIRPDNFIRLSNGDWILIDWAAAHRCEHTDHERHHVVCEYAGCVTTAADSVLHALAKTSESDSLPNIPVSRATDCISLLRSVFLMTSRLSPLLKSNLAECRNDHNFKGVAEWWKGVLPPMYTDFERTINEILVSGGDIYDAMECFLVTNVAPVL